MMEIMSYVSVKIRTWVLGKLPKFNMCSYGAIRNDIQLIIHARTNGAKFNMVMSRIAIQYGYLEMVKWLKSKGCPFSICM
jgi:hypothetical protein